MTAAIVIPVFNRRDITLRFLGSLYSDKPDNYFIIVVDSGSTDGTGPAIRENFPDVILLQATPAAWWAAATNMGTKEAIRRGCSYIITCNDDSLVSVNALNHMLETARENPGSIISATVCYLDARDTVYFAGRKRSKFTDRFFYIANLEYYNKLTDELGEADLLHGMCTLFPATVFETVGYFDEVNFPHLFADDDLVLRAREHGYRL
ncbi:MAG TPA: glycosyltransferase family 2 protein, partial [Gammaproteobacteria bacterium]|nr:glycosyltransferase family 2 protein [Gammaproteobacteria bacterium]